MMRDVRWTNRRTGHRLVGFTSYTGHPAANIQLQRLLQERGDPVVVAAAELELRSVVENDGVFTSEGRAELSQPVDVDDGGTVDADEALWIEAGLEARHRLAHQVRAS